MSDALTDIARDEARGRAYSKYLAALRDFLKSPTSENRALVAKTAEATDSVHGGYWSRQGTNLAQKLDTTLESLTQGEKRVWAKLLTSLGGHPDLGVFKELSPFKGKLLITVDYGQGFVTLKGEFEEFVASLVRSNGWRTYDCDDYMIAIDRPTAEDAEVVWLRCGIGGVRAPRETRASK